VVAVAVLDVRIESSEEPLKDNELEITTKRGSGPGGQARNKTESCVRIRHIPTGLTVVIDSRDQAANKKKARQILASRVSEQLRSKLSDNHSREKREQFDGGGRGNKTRTYNFIDGRVIDHRLDTKTTQIQRVMKGDFDLLWTT
jgi:peptide chain release factor 1